MRTTVIPAKALTQDHVAEWVALQTADRTIDSPFFRPEFTKAVAAVCDNIEVAVLELNGSTAGFLPFYRDSRNEGWPLPLSEFQGLILRPEVSVDARDLIRGCQLSAWHFDHLVATQTGFQPFHWDQCSSPYIDTTMGFENYSADRCRAGSKTLSKTLRKFRNLHREVGGVRFEVAIHDEHVLEALIAWKSEQFTRSRLFNPFSREWTRRLFRILLDSRDVGCCGTLSALYADNRIQAIVYGLRSHHVLHTWVCAYRPQIAKFSPGYQLLVNLIQTAPSLGIQRIDLSKGNERYKKSFMSGAIPLAAGSVDSRARRIVGYMAHRAYSRLRRSPLRGALTIPWRWVKRAYYQAQFP